MKLRPYRSLSVTLLISLFIMYAVMFLNVDEVSHIYISLTRFYMSLLMVTPMAVLMIGMMRKMYMNRMLNTAIICVSIIVFGTSLFCLRTQAFISDSEYMKAMIPHHSSAILTSKHAMLKDPHVKALSEGIIASQEKEINEMKELLKKQ